MAEYQSENNIASLVTKNSFVMVGPSDEGALITVESPDSMAVEVDPKTRRVVAALKFYKSDSEAPPMTGPCCRSLTASGAARGWSTSRSASRVID
jgi:hypothetical protein